jgi:hypothetical protein
VPFHCSHNARPVGERGVSAPRGRAGENRKQALVGRAQFAPCPATYPKNNTSPAGTCLLAEYWVTDGALVTRLALDRLGSLSIM